MLLAEARCHLEALAGCVSEIEIGALDADSARDVLELGAAIKRLGAGLELLVASRAVQGAPWRAEGHRSEASWLAEVTRSSVSDAVATKVASERLEKLEATADALRRGSLSPTETKAVASAASADPGAEAELLEAARRLPMGEFSRYAREVANVAHERDPEHRARLWRNRFLNCWTDNEGMFRFAGGLTPDAGARFVSAVRSQAEHVRSEGRRANLPEEPPGAYDADALVSLVCGQIRRESFSGPEVTRGSGPQWNGVYHVSLESLRRGQMEPGEICEIAGVGPVPLEVVEHLMGSAMAKLVIEDGVDVRTVAHLGRTVPAQVETALMARDRTCVVPACTVAHGLEIDHWQIPFARGGPTELWNLARICAMHYRMKTYGGYQLLGGPGKWEWLPPD